MTTRRSLLLGAAGAVTVSGLAGAPDAAFAQGAVIDITRARTNPIPIAIPDFAGAGDGQRSREDGDKNEWQLKARHLGCSLSVGWRSDDGEQVNREVTQDGAPDHACCGDWAVGTRV